VRSDGDLGFKVETLFTSALKINARDGEDFLQFRFQPGQQTISAEIEAIFQDCW
jgi:hypothetical protein